MRDFTLPMNETQIKVHSWSSKINSMEIVNPTFFTQENVDIKDSQPEILEKSNSEFDIGP